MVYIHCGYIDGLCCPQYFRREETNFISQNEIDNMTLIMPTASSRSRVSAVTESATGGGKVKVSAPPPRVTFSLF